jgi:hypothetical protein
VKFPFDSTSKQSDVRAQEVTMQEIKLSEWCVVCTNGEWFCGKRDPEKARRLVSLQKVLFQFGVEPSSKGPRPKTIVLTYPYHGIEQLDIPEGALWLAATQYQDVPWEELIYTTEKLKVEQRAQRAGLLV